MSNDRDQDSFAGSRKTQGIVAKDMLLEAHNLLKPHLEQSRIAMEPDIHRKDGDRLAEKLLREEHR